MGLQVPATSYLKPMASMKLKKKEDYDRDDELTGKKLFKPTKHMPKDSAGKLDVTEPTRSHSPLKKAKKVDSKPKDGIDRVMPSTKFQGLSFTHHVPNFTKA